MIKINKLLFPVDLSEISPQIVPYVKTIADKFNTQIHLLFVVRMLDHFSGFDVPSSSIFNFQTEVRKGVEKKLYVFKEEYFEEFENTHVTVKIGSIPEEIIRYAETENMDMIIMGTHGRRGIEKLFFGSVAERIVKLSQIPVLLVNPYKSNPAKENNVKERGE